MIEHLDIDKRSAGKTPLHLARQLGHLEVCQRILAHVVDKNTRDRKDHNGKTPFETMKSAPIKKTKKDKLL